MLSSDTAADVLVALEEDFRVEFMEYFSINELANFIEILDSDDGADLLNELSSSAPRGNLGADQK